MRDDRAVYEAKEEARSRVSGEVAAYQPPTQEEEVERRK